MGTEMPVWERRCQCGRGDAVAGPGGGIGPGEVWALLLGTCRCRVCRAAKPHAKAVASAPPEHPSGHAAALASQISELPLLRRTEVCRARLRGGAACHKSGSCSPAPVGNPEMRRVTPYPTNTRWHNPPGSSRWDAWGRGAWRSIPLALGGSEQSLPPDTSMGQAAAMASAILVRMAAGAGQMGAVGRALPSAALGSAHRQPTAPPVIANLSF